MAKSGADADYDGPPTCPYCGNENPVLVAIDSGMRLALNKASVANVPEQVCDGCHLQLLRLVSKGAALRQEARRKEENRLALWRNRVQLVKQAKTLMAANSYADAAVAFEKYLRALEIVYDKKPGELTPELFKADKRQQEITVIASVYWDLMRLYDANSRYAERQMKAAKKLSEFIRFTPVFGFIMRKAESQTRTAKNPAAFKALLKMSNSNRPRCFIATAAFDGGHPVVEALCQFRDRRLLPTVPGRIFISAYYRFSPPLARALDSAPALKPPVRWALAKIAALTSEELKTDLNACSRATGDLYGQIKRSN